MSSSNSLLRVYSKKECDQNNVPLDWKRCRMCKGTGRWRDPLIPQFPVRQNTVECPTCRGYGSLRAAALAHLGIESIRRGDYDGIIKTIVPRHFRASSRALISFGTLPLLESGWSSRSPS